MSRYCVIFVIGRLLLVLVAVNNLKIIRSEYFCVYFLNAVYELDRGCVAVLSEERNCYITCFNSFENVAHRFVNEKRILDFALWFLCALAVESLYYLCIIGFRSSWFFGFILVITVLIARLE
jgi:hypothetical protein